MKKFRSTSVSYVVTDMFTDNCVFIIKTSFFYLVDLGIPFEPPIQRKKRTGGPKTSLSTNFYESPGRFSDDYQLLGANDKFVPNVKYRSKSHGRAPSPPKQQKLSRTTVCPYKIS